MISFGLEIDLEILGVAVFNIAVLMDYRVKQSGGAGRISELN